jgi:RNA polymerase sigma factor (sigma-70 family)
MKEENKTEINLIDYMPLLYKLSAKFPDEFRDDLIQEGYLALNDALKSFKQGLGTPFQTFAYKRVYYSMVDYMGNEQNTLSLDVPIFDNEGDETSLIDLLEDDSDLFKEIENRDFYKRNIEESSTVDGFIKQRYYEQNMTPQEILDVYSEIINIRDIRKIKKILKS